MEKLKHDDNSAQYQLELTNRFQALQVATDIEEQWHLFRKAVTDSAGITVGRRHGSYKEWWIQDSTWTIIDQRKAAKQSREQARTCAQKEQTVNKYKELE